MRKNSLMLSVTLSVSFAVFCFTILALKSGPVQAADADPTLTIRFGNESRVLKRSELLKRGDVTKLHLEHHPSYAGKPMDYEHVVPLRALFDGINVPTGAILQFNCTDGFSAPLSKERVLGDGKSDSAKNSATPFLAIEAPGEKWPLVSGTKDPAPFYLVWKDPEKSKIGGEEWPYALSGFTVKESLQATFPHIIPAKGNAAVERGLQLFTQNCFGCHTLNLEGQSQMGPDLNVPMSPTEYFTDAHIKKLVRAPQSIRSWPQGKMPGFSKESISDAQLDDLITYLKHMAKHKVTLPAKSP